MLTLVVDMMVMRRPRIHGLPDGAVAREDHNRRWHSQYHATGTGKISDTCTGARLFPVHGLLDISLVDGLMVQVVARPYNISILTRNTHCWTSQQGHPRAIYEYFRVELIRVL
jgi:hypothetical protein